VLRANPKHTEANLLLANHYESRGNRLLASQHLEVVSAALPARDDLKLRLATLYASLGRFDEGITRAEEVTAARPKVPQGHYVLGDLHLRRGQLPEAIASFRTAVRLDPNMAIAHFALGSAHERLREFDKAAEAYKRAQLLAPRDPRAYNNLAWIYAAQGKNLDAALSLAQKARELASSPTQRAMVPGILDTLGFVHYARGEYTQAEPVLTKAYELAANDATIQYHLGMTYYRLGQKDQAATWLRRSLQNGGNFAEAGRIRDLLKELGG